MSKKASIYRFVLVFSIITLSGLAIAGCTGPMYASGNDVYIYDNYFSPTPRTIMAGTTVTWMNYGSNLHTVTSDLPSTELDSGTLNSGDSYSHMFTVVGTYDYHCVIHGMGMMGEIIVTN